MNIKCPHCGTEYEVEREWYGQYTTCESCGKGFVVGMSINQPMTGATSLRANTPHTGRGKGFVAGARQTRAQMVRAGEGLTPMVV